MASSAGADPKLTRPDQKLPERPANGDGGAPAGAPDDVPNDVPGGAGAAAPSGGAAGRGAAVTWQRFHYAVGVFLVAYGLTTLLGGGLQWDDRREELETYFDSGPAGAILIAVKAVEVLLVVITVVGLVRRRDVWFVPPLAGWMAGFAMFAVLDVLKGRWGGLVEHLVYLAGFVVLLFLSYGLSAKAQLGNARRAAAAGAAPAGDGAAGGAPGEGRLTRTQELAIAALNRLPRR
ncbi:hypothetical protein [Actinomadura fibrosa]|uniref:DoxX family protein n=1 Tax=Actinomadura fibrosa TaxID=111802 RepID=A0ABW2XYL2_9ACTN|nr:hypothetical protein [Actinomadura fibrosa]